MKDFCFNKITRRCFLENMVKLFSSIGLSSIFLDCNKTEASVNPSSGFEPAYLKLHKTGELKKRAEELWAIMEDCELCPRRCGVNRHKGKRGVCQAPGTDLVISAHHQHFGEERPLVGKGGSGTIFLTHCNLRCAFCQNWEIAHRGTIFRTHVGKSRPIRQAHRTEARAEIFDKSTDHSLFAQEPLVRLCQLPRFPDEDHRHDQASKRGSLSRGMSARRGAAASLGDNKGVSTGQSIPSAGSSNRTLISDSG